MKFAIILALTLCSISFARADDVFTYSCKAKTVTYTLKINADQNKLFWRGKTYSIKVDEDCAKYGWEVKGQGETFQLCTATQGYADFVQDGVTYVCQQQVP